MSTNATCWEDAYRVQTERIVELRRENAALRAELRSERQSVYNAKQVEIPALLRENAALRAAAVEVCALARVWVTVWGDKLSAESIRRLAELEKQILKEVNP